MKLGPYAAAPEGLISIVIQIADAWRLGLAGVPRMPGTTAAEIARNVLRRNAGDVLSAGMGHFWPMWPVDFAKTLRGARHALPHEYLGRLLDRMFLESARQGRVTSCFSAYRGFDMPYHRADNLPWLLWAAAEHRRFSGDPWVVERHRPAMQELLDAYEAETLEEGGLVSTKVTGDWMDTVLRPSSTYNNLCVWKLLQLAPELGLRTREKPDAFGRRLMEDRWCGAHFRDYAGTDRPSVDAAVLALYLGLLPETLARAVLDGIESSELLTPFPLRSSTTPYETSLLTPLARLTSAYHSIVWPHLGCMYLNGAKRYGRDVSKHQAALEALFVKNGNMVETVDLDGRPYFTPVFAAEPGLSMAAGQYLELALG